MTSRRRLREERLTNGHTGYRPARAWCTASVITTAQQFDHATGPTVLWEERRQVDGPYPARCTATKIKAAPRQVSAMTLMAVAERFCECASGRISEALIYRRNPAKNPK